MTQLRTGSIPAVDEQGRSVEFVPSKASDNPHLDKNYHKQLDAISDPERRRALRDGDWDILAGAAFGEWNRDRHVVEPFDIPKEWARRAGIDYGFRVWAVVWLAIDNDQRVLLPRSVEEPGPRGATRRR